jgi:transcriptional regulator with XRE-family HTH domain
MPNHPHSHHYSSNMALGARLKHWRLRENLKIAEVAAKLGVCTATWGHWETGFHLPSGDLLLAIEKLTAQPLHVLFCTHLEGCPQLRPDAPAVAAPCCCHRDSSGVPP